MADVAPEIMDGTDSETLDEGFATGIEGEGHDDSTSHD
jgi:hypothetical protein